MTHIANKPINKKYRPYFFFCFCFISRLFRHFISCKVHHWVSLENARKNRARNKNQICFLFFLNLILGCSGCPLMRLWDKEKQQSSLTDRLDVIVVRCCRASLITVGWNSQSVRSAQCSALNFWQFDLDVSNGFVSWMWKREVEQIWKSDGGLLVKHPIQSLQLQHLHMLTFRYVCVFISSLLA